MTSPDQRHIPIRLRARVEEIDAITDAFAAEHLNDEYATLCLNMSAALARKRSSPLGQADARTWAAAILHAVGWVNFLTDPSQVPHMTTAQLAFAAGVSKHSLERHSRRVRDALDLWQFHPAWTLPSKLADNPLVWTFDVDGLAMDLRRAPRALQEEAFRRGLIPYIPGPDGTAADLEESDDGEDFDFFDDPRTPPAGDKRDRNSDAGTAGLHGTAQELIDGVLGEFQSPPSLDQLNRALGQATSGYNRRPQAGLGGLSPMEVQRLIDADWTSPTSAIKVNDTLSLDELAPSSTLDDARLLLHMMGEQGRVKATPKGNLSRAFVTEFRERMRSRGTSLGELEHGPEGRPRTLNEENVFTLHIARLLLEQAGLTRRQKGAFSRTKLGERLTDDGRAGELFAMLIRSHFRRLNLAYLDGAAEAPGFQHTVGCTFYQFSRSSDEWKQAGQLVAALVLPDVVAELPVNQYVDMPAFVLATRFLRPLERFGLAETREIAREPGAMYAGQEWRKAVLFDRVMRFEIGDGSGSRDS